MAKYYLYDDVVDVTHAFELDDTMWNKVEVTYYGGTVTKPRVKENPMEHDEVVYEAKTPVEYVIQTCNEFNGDTKWRDEEIALSLEAAKLYADYLVMIDPVQDVRVVRRNYADSD